MTAYRIDRRTFLGGIGAAIAARPLDCAFAATTAATSVTGLRVDYLEAPLAIDSERPLLSWRLESVERNLIQVSYRVRAARPPLLPICRGRGAISRKHRWLPNRYKQKKR